MADDPIKVIPPKPEIAERAHIGSMEEYERLYRLSLDEPEKFWAEQAERLTWFHPWKTVFDHDYENVDFGWYLGGRLNASTTASTDTSTNGATRTPSSGSRTSQASTSTSPTVSSSTR